MDKPIPPQTCWFTGLPAAGKTTLSVATGAVLRQHGLPVCLLDGDELRAGLCRDLGFSPADRAENMRRVAEMARLLNDQGLWVLVALVSPSVAGRETARQIIGSGRFVEVHVATPLAVCQSRDPKGLYAQAKANPDLALTGVQAPYEPPLQPDLIIHTETSATEISVQAIAALLLRAQKNPLTVARTNTHERT
jgi:adenylylsulfate kinase